MNRQCTLPQAPAADIENRAPGKRAFAARTAASLFMSLALCIFLCGCMKDTANGTELKRQAASSPETAAAGAPAPVAGKNKQPVEWDLTPEAEHMYFCLLLSEAVATENEDLLFTALEGLLKYETSLEMYRDGISLLLTKGRFEESVTFAEKGLKAYPDNETLALMLAVAYSENHQGEKALKVLETARKKHPGSMDIIQELIRLYTSQGKNKEAEDLFMELPVKDLEPRLLFLRAHILASNGKSAQARLELRKIIGEKPDFLEAWLELGLLCEREKDYTAAAEVYEKAVKLAPDNLDIWFRLMVVLVDGKKPKEAMSAVKRAPGTGAFLLQASYFFIEADYLDQAKAILEEAENKGVHQDEVLLYRSVLKYRETGDGKAATATLENIPPHSPFYEKGLLRRIQILLDAKLFEDALTAAQFARGAFPKNQEFWSIESFTLLQLKKPEEAEQVIREAVAAFPKDEEMLYSLGSLLEETGRRKESMEVMEGLLKLNPSNYRAMNHVGYILAEENRDLERALRLVTGALRQNPNADYIVDSLAWVQFRLGKLDNAWESINRCIDLGGDDPAIWEHYGDIALALGKKKEARKGYDEALKREASNADEITKKINGI